MGNDILETEAFFYQIEKSDVIVIWVVEGALEGFISAFYSILFISGRSRISV